MLCRLLLILLMLYVCVFFSLIDSVLLSLAVALLACFEWIGRLIGEQMNFVLFLLLLLRLVQLLQLLSWWVNTCNPHYDGSVVLRFGSV